MNFRESSDFANMWDRYLRIQQPSFGQLAGLYGVRMLTPEQQAMFFCDLTQQMNIYTHLARLSSAQQSNGLGTYLAVLRHEISFIPSLVLPSSTEHDEHDNELSILDIFFERFHLGLLFDYASQAYVLSEILSRYYKKRDTRKLTPITELTETTVLKYLGDIFRSKFYTNYFGQYCGFIPHISSDNYHHYSLVTISVSDGLPVDQSSELRPLFLTRQTEQVFSTLNNSFTSQQPVTRQHVTTVRLGVGELVRIISDFHARYCRLRDPVANTLFLNRKPSMLEIYSHARRLNLRPLNPSEFSSLSHSILPL